MDQELPALTASFVDFPSAVIKVRAAAHRFFFGLLTFLDEQDVNIVSASVIRPAQGTA
jgi:hypothetical protein